MGTSQSQLTLAPSKPYPVSHLVRLVDLHLDARSFVTDPSILVTTFHLILLDLYYSTKLSPNLLKLTGMINHHSQLMTP